MAELPPDGFEEGHNPDTPPDGFESHSGLSDYLTSAWQDVKNAGAGTGALVKLAVKTPGYELQTAKDLAQGKPLADTPVGHAGEAVKDMVVEALPHKEGDKWSAGSTLQRVGELTPGADKALDAMGIQTDDKLIGHPGQAFKEHPVNTLLDYMIALGPAKTALLKGAGLAADAGKMAEVAGKAGAAGEEIEKVGHVGDKVGTLEKVLSTTSNMPQAAFQALKDSPELMKSGPEVSDAVDMLHDAVNKDLPDMMKEPSANIGKQITQGVEKVKGQYGQLLDQTGQQVMQHLDDLKKAASADYDAQLGKMGMKESLSDWMKTETGKAPNVNTLKKDYMTLSKINDAEPTKLKGMFDLRQNLDDMIDYAGQEKSGITSKEARRLEEFRTEVDSKLGSLPGGDAIHALDDKWSSVMQNRRALYQKFSNPDTAAKTLDGLVSGDKSNRVTSAALQDLEKLTGKPVVQPFMEQATPLRNTVDDLEPHLKNPEATQKLLEDHARGKAPTLQQQAIANLDAMTGSKINEGTQALKPLADLKSKLGSHFAEPGQTENLLKKIFENPNGNKDLQDTLAHLEQVTGKPLGQTINDALTKMYANEAFNSSKGNLMLRAFIPVLAGGAASTGHIASAAAMINAISPKMIAKEYEAAMTAKKMGEAAGHATHLGGLSFDKLGIAAGKVGQASEQESRKEALKNALRKKD